MRKRLYLTGEIAHLEKVSCQTVRNWIGAGLLEVEAIANGKYLISEEAIRKLQEKRSGNIKKAVAA